MELKIMTFNLRVDVKSDGINYFPNREERVLETIRREAPDVIGFQEARDYARRFLKERLTDYTVVGCGRDADYRGEACLIAFRKDSMELVNLETRFLSTTPTLPGSRYVCSDQSSCPRLYVHAELSHEGCSETFHLFNTHLDHKGAQAQFLGMTQILGHISEVSGKVILTGDMNARPDSPCIALPAALPGRTLTDVTADISHTFHGFGRYEEGVKIDYIFTDAKALSVYRAEDTPIDGMYASDHYPVCAVLEL